MAKIWAHSGDSHFLEPEDLWQQILPAPLAERMPWSERDGDDEIVHVDGKTFRRKLPKLATKKGSGGLDIVELSTRPPGARDIECPPARPRPRGHLGRGRLRLARAVEPDDRGPGAGARGQPGRERVDRRGDPGRRRPTASCRPRSCRSSTSSTRSTRLQHVAEIGLHVVSLPTGVPAGVDDYNRDSWEPLWAAVEETGHGARVPHRLRRQTTPRSMYRGPGGAVLNYVETTYGGQRVGDEAGDLAARSTVTRR